MLCEVTGLGDITEGKGVRAGAQDEPWRAPTLRGSSGEEEVLMQAEQDRP